jgi:predicted HicB family RNase H-like nuclease
MSKPMTHKGYSARIEYSDEDGCFVGRVSGIRDIITFHGDSVAEIRKAFEDAVDFYLESCSARGESPNKPFTGRFVVRVSPELHSSIAIAARRDHKSINAWVAEVCESHAG